MKPMVIYIDGDGSGDTISITRQKLEKLIKDAYDSGHSDGYSKGYTEGKNTAPQ